MTRASPSASAARAALAEPLEAFRVEEPATLRALAGADHLEGIDGLPVVAQLADESFGLTKLESKTRRVCTNASVSK